MRYPSSIGGIGTVDSYATLRALDEHYSSRDDEIAATRHITKAIRALPVWAKTPNSYAQLLAVILSEIEHSGWGHASKAEAATNEIASAHDLLEGV